MLETSQQAIDCSKYLKAVSDPDRLRIIGVLQAGPHTVGVIADALGRSIANTSHHLKLLRAAGVVTPHKTGRFVRYSLAAEVARQSKRTGLDVLEFGCCRLELGARGT